MGSVRELTDNDAVVRGRWDFDSYGKRSANLITSSALEADFAYTGHYLHERSGLDLAPWRGYDPNIGVWLSRDPIGENGGFNLYGYVGNRPINKYDPYGEEGLVAVYTAEVAIVGFVAFKVLQHIINHPEIFQKITDRDLDDDGEYDPAPTPTPKAPARPGVQPVDCPAGTIPIDQDPRTKDDVHDIKDGLKGDGVGPDSWIGITPGGDIIVTNPNGSPENLGPFQPHLPK